MKRIEVLDGWRAASILLVLAGHLLPLGPKSWEMNGAVAALGMALFFTLSGFLITQFLLARPEAGVFLRRRLFRILPLAWAAMALLCILQRASTFQIIANLAFFANLPPQQLLAGGGHLWSLCVEMQFYFAVAVLVAVAGRRGLLVLPLVGLGVTALRITAGDYIDIVTWFRIDEILAGATISLCYAYLAKKGEVIRLPSWLFLAFLLLALAAGHPATGPLNYLRPYLAASAIGASIFAMPRWVRAAFTSRSAAYIAEVSYALYVFHGMLTATWLGRGSSFVKYLKRPLLLSATFLLAHLSTIYFERPMITLGKRSWRRSEGAGLASKKT